MSSSDSQNHIKLRETFEAIKRLALSHEWQPGPQPDVEMSLWTSDHPESVSFEAVCAIVDYAKCSLGVDLNLVGGGYGCLDMRFSAPHGSSDILEQAILKDNNFQICLNNARLHLVRVATPGRICDFAGFYEVPVGIATNRKMINADGLLHTEGAFADKRTLFPDRLLNIHWTKDLFTNTYSNTLRYAAAEALVLDTNDGQTKENMLKRLWDRITLSSEDRRLKHDRFVIQRIQFGKRRLEDILRRPHAGVVLHVHGYNTDFSESLHDIIAMHHNYNLKNLTLVPVLFSWPSKGSRWRYRADEKIAERSEYALQEALQLVEDAMNGRRICVLAHSHGSKVLVRSLSSSNEKHSTRNLHNVVLSEPDVDVIFLEQRLNCLLDRCRRLTLYFSNNDKALKLAEFLNDTPSAGRNGVQRIKIASENIDKLAIINVSRVSRGWVRHSPHMDSAEVRSDIHYLLLGLKANERHMMRNIGVARYELTPS